MTSLIEPINVHNFMKKNKKNCYINSFSRKDIPYPDIKTEIKTKSNILIGNEPINNSKLELNINNLNFSKLKGVIDSKFFLIKKIGQGSSAKVYLGISKDSLYSNDTNQIKYYSIKVIDPLKMDINMFKKEVELLQNINHENVLKIFAYGIGKKEKIKNNQKLGKDIYYIVMEYLEHDESLKYITQVTPGENKGFGEDFGRLIFSQLLDGLEAMHNKNIFHRDIKPDNIMIGGEDYKFKFVDFGFSTDNIGRLNTYLGTPNYAAPELHLKRPYFGKSEDIFSLGVSLFVLVTGGLPFKLAVPNDSFYQHIVKSDYVEYWRKRMVNVSPSFMELFDNLVAFDYSQRPSISEIRESSWMKEINWDLMPYLKQELILREKIIIERKNEEYLRQLREKQEKDNKIFENNFSLLETKKQIRNYGNIKNNLNNTKDNDFNEKNIINNCKINNNINPNKIIINLEDINNSSENKESINQIGNDEIIVESSEDKKVNENIDFNEKIDENGKNHKKELTGGFIPIQIESKNLNIAMTKIKKYLKNKGYFPIRRNFNDLELIISDGEVDILLKIEKFKKDYTKLSYFKLKGIITQFDLFRKEIQSLKNKLL